MKINFTEFNEFDDFLKDLQETYEDLIYGLEIIKDDLGDTVCGKGKDSVEEIIDALIHEFKSRDRHLIDDLQDEVSKYRHIVINHGWITAVDEDITCELENLNELDSKVNSLETQWDMRRSLYANIDMPNRVNIAWDIQGEERDELEDYIDVSKNQLEIIQSNLMSTHSSIEMHMDNIQDLVNEIKQFVDNDAHAKSSMDHVYAGVVIVIAGVAVAVVAVLTVEVWGPILVGAISIDAAVGAIVTVSEAVIDVISTAIIDLGLDILVKRIAGALVDMLTITVFKILMGDPQVTINMLVGIKGVWDLLEIGYEDIIEEGNWPEFWSDMLAYGGVGLLPTPNNTADSTNMSQESSKSVAAEIDDFFDYDSGINEEVEGIIEDIQEQKDILDAIYA